MKIPRRGRPRRSAKTSVRPSLRRAKGKGAIRGLVHRGARSDKAPRVVKKVLGFKDPTVCERCGAVFSHKTWRRREPVDVELLARATWDVCPACRQVARGESFGRVVIRATRAGIPEGEILRRIENVSARAEFTQPERRIVAVRQEGQTIEVRTTSQKLAHRIAHELQKAFGGHASYAWSDRDGRLDATWDA